MWLVISVGRPVVMHSIHHLLTLTPEVNSSITLLLLAKENIDGRRLQSGHAFKKAPYSLYGAPLRALCREQGAILGHGQYVTVAF